VAKENNSPISRSAENAPSDYTQLSIEVLATQDHKSERISFITGARSLNEQDLHDNLAYFKVPKAGIESIRSTLAFKIFDEYVNILKGM
jgi:hypothetical protein